MTLDPRAIEMGNTVVDYSINTGKGDIILITSDEYNLEYVECLMDLVRAKGAEAIVETYCLRQQRKMIERNDLQELAEESKRLCELAEMCTGRIKVYALSDPLYLQGIDPKKIADYEAIIVTPVDDRICGDGAKFKMKKWNLCAFPTQGEARQIGMTLDEYADFVYNAANVDWKRKGEVMKIIKQAFDDADDVHILVPGMTDFGISLKGRGGSICDGHLNMPDGEVYFGPLEDSANGTIHFPYETLRSGNIVKGITLKYENGIVVEAHAQENQAFLESMLALPGARKIGELGIGCNRDIQRHTGNLLFDEKIGGTIHIALGAAYAEPLDNGGGLNKGDIHWDNVCDLRKIAGMPGGRIYVNGELVQKDGEWVFVTIYDSFSRPETRDLKVR
jgi:aminopeptidase